MEVPVLSSLKRRAEEVIHDLLPKKSKERYNVEYKKFCSWLETENVERGTVSDDIMLVYLSDISKVNKPTTMWSKFSMIKSNFKIFENVDFSTFSKSISFLKRKSDGYKPTKSKVFTADQVSKFLIDSDDKEWLLCKVILTIGVCGACRKDDLLNLKFNDVKDNGNYFTVFVEDGKTPVHRSFAITDEECPYKPCMFIRKYISLRPSSMTSNRFFVGYRYGKCVAQNVGANSIAAVPCKVAKYLGLENPEQYTGHALRRTSGSMLVEGGGDLQTLKRHGCWKSSTVDETGVVHIIFKPSSSTYQADKEMAVKPIQYTTEQRIANHSPLAGEMSSVERTDKEGYTEHFMKFETNSSDLDSISDRMEIDETNEFCGEYYSDESTSSIPSEKLNLVHLDGINQLVNEGRNSDSYTNFAGNSDNVLQVKSLNALNSVAENGDTHHGIEFVNVLRDVKQQICKQNFQVPTTPSSLNLTCDATTCDIDTPVAELISVESVAEQVMEKLLSSTSTNPEVLHALLQSSVLKNKIGKQTPPVLKKSPARPKAPTINQMQDIGCKVLRMFVIDKQIEKLMQEKKDIYKELFSIGEISSSLLNSWAQEKIQRKNNGKVASE